MGMLTKEQEAVAGRKPWSWSVEGTSKVVIVSDADGIPLMRMYAGRNGKSNAAALVDAVNATID